MEGYTASWPGSGGGGISRWQCGQAEGEKISGSRYKRKETRDIKPSSRVYVRLIKPV